MVTVDQPDPYGTTTITMAIKPFTNWDDPPCFPFSQFAGWFGLEMFFLFLNGDFEARTS